MQIDGSDGPDTLLGTAFNDTLNGYDGHDRLEGLDGDDYLAGGLGNETLLGGAGNDTLQSVFQNGEPDASWLDGGDGNDAVAGAGTLIGGAGNDTLGPSSDSALLDAGSGDDWLSIRGVRVAEALAGDGNDLVFLQAGGWADSLEGGAGYDELQVSVQPNTSFLDGASGFEYILLSASSGAAPIVLRDTLVAAGDRLRLVTYGAWVDGAAESGAALHLIAANDQFIALAGGAGDDTLVTRQGFLDGGAGNDRLLAFDWMDRNDTLSGGAGDDLLNAGPGADVVEGGAGNDDIDAGLGFDVARYSGRMADYRIEHVLADVTDLLFDRSTGVFGDVASRAQSQVLVLRVTDLREGNPDGVDLLRGVNRLVFADGSVDLPVDGRFVQGTEAAETLVGGDADAADTILGFGGDDSLRGAEGDDWLEGGDGNDYLSGNLGADTLLGGAGNDSLQGTDAWGEPDASSMHGGDGDDVLSGAGTLVGGSGHDVLGATGASALVDGGEGNDWIQLGYALIDPVRFGDPESVLTVSLGTVLGGAGDDSFDLFSWGTGSSIALLDGGEGYDTLRVKVVAPGLLDSARNFEYIVLREKADDTLLVLPDTLVAPAGTLRIYSTGTSIDGSLELDGAFHLIGALDLPVTLIGGAGDDTLVARSGRLEGGAGNDRLLTWDWGSVDDTLLGGAGDDSLSSALGADVLEGGAGDDEIDGGQGFDVARYGGSRTDYRVEQVIVDVTELLLDRGPATPFGDLHARALLQVPVIRVTDLREGSPDGTDLLRGVNQLHFADGVLDLPSLGQRVQGTDGPESLEGGDADAPDTLLGAGGDDTLRGFDGNDSLVGGDGNDFLWGNLGSDTLLGGAGNDSLQGVDHAWGEADGSSMDGGEGDDVLGGAGTLLGGLGNDVLAANGPSALVDGGEGNDWIQLGYALGDPIDWNHPQEALRVSLGTVQGGADDDIVDLYSWGDGSSVALLDGGAGHDLLRVKAVEPGVLDGARNFESIVLRDHRDDTLLTLRDTLVQAGASLHLYAIGTSIDGSAETDGSFHLVGAYDRPVTLIGGAGNDTLVAMSGFLDGGAGGDRLLVALPSPVSDTLLGGDGDDTISAGAGADLVTGGAGNDVIDMGAGFDTVVFSGRREDYRVEEVTTWFVELLRDTSTGVFGDWQERTVEASVLRVTDLRTGGTDGIDLVRGANRLQFSDQALDLVIPGLLINGSAGNDALSGAEGNDSIAGADGDDLLQGDLGDDLLEGGGGNDTVSGGLGNDMVVGGHGGGDDVYDGGEGTDTLRYWSAVSGVHVDLAAGLASGAEIGTDTFSGFELVLGGPGNDTFRGGQGADTFTGGAGSDTFLLAASASDVDWITDFSAGDVLRLEAAVNIAPLRAGSGQVLEPGGVQISRSADGATLSFDTDGQAGADVSVRLSGEWQPGDFRLSLDGDRTELRVNQRPVQTQVLPTWQALAGNEFHIRLPDAFRDAEADTITFSASLSDGSPLPTGWAILGATGEITGRAGQPGAHVVRVTATDFWGAAVSALFELVIVNASPAARDDTLAGVEDTVLRIPMASLLANDTDANADVLSVTGVTATVGGTVRLLQGEVLFTPDADFNGAAGFQYTVTDGLGATSTATVTVNVAPMAEPPNATGSVWIDGEALQGETLSVRHTLQDPDGIGAIQYQWFADAAAIPGATQATLALSQALVGKTLTVRASWVDGSGAAEARTSASSTIVRNVNDLPAGHVSVAVVWQAGPTLTASANLSDDDGIGPMAYRWIRDGVVVATGSTYRPAAVELGKGVQVEAAYTDAEGTQERVRSAVVVPFGDGDDAFTGAGGAEYVSAGGGSDTLRGGAGDDTIDGGGDTDTVLYTRPSTEYLLEAVGLVTRVTHKNDGADGVDLLSNVEELRFTDVTVVAERQGQTIYGTAARNDVLVGSGDRDVLVGLGGNDYLYGGEGRDYLYGGEGGDVLIGEGGNDILVADQGSDYLFGGSGNDSLYGGAGVDVFLGGAGADFMSGDEGAGYFYGETGDDFALGGSVNDIFVGGDGNDRFFGNGGNDFAYAGSGNDTLHGGEGVDVLLGEAGDDLFDGGDSAAGAVDVDYLFLGAMGNDTVVFRATSSVQVIHDFEAGGIRDRFEFSGVPFRSLADVLVSTTDMGSYSIITVDADTNIWVIGVRPGEFTQADFLFG